MTNKIDLKSKKNSIKYIYKITKSMEMVSLSKYKFFINKIESSKKYINLIYKLINNIDYIDNDYFLYKDNLCKKNILYIVISTNQGLCSNININLYKEIILDIKKNFFFKNKIYFLLLGKKSSILIKKLKKINIKFKIFKKNIFFYNISNYRTNNIAFEIINFYKKKNSIVFIANNKFKNKKYITNIKQLLPILFKKKNNKVNYLYESNKNKLHNNLLFMYIKSKIYDCILNNIVSEYFSRILVMKNASLNSKNLFKKLDLMYNKIRQFNITKEITELISNLNILK